MHPVYKKCMLPLDITSVPRCIRHRPFYTDTQIKLWVLKQQMKTMLVIAKSWAKYCATA